MIAPGLGTRLFEAKIRIPSPAKASICRPRLFKQLNEAADCKLIVISAPAGFGKTTLVTTWLRNGQCAAPPAGIVAVEKLPEAAWLSLDERENDLAEFAGHFTAAIQLASPELSFETPNLLRLSVAPSAPEISALPHY